MSLALQNHSSGANAQDFSDLLGGTAEAVPFQNMYFQQFLVYAIAQGS
jgi:hypothetical protein